MKLIFIYGPPAVGKLTVAKELAKRMGFKVFHNHLTRDLVLTVFDETSDYAIRLVDKLRLEILGTAAQANVSGVVFTLVYAYPQDNRFVSEVITTVESHGGEVDLVQLYCSRDRLLGRVGSVDRAEFTKIQKPEELKEIMQKYDLFTAFPERESLRIDNTDLTAQQVVNRIVNHFHL